MKKVIGITIALVLAVMVSLCFGGVALADGPPDPDGGVFTHWDFDGEGKIEINTTDYLSYVKSHVEYQVGSFDHFVVETSGSGSEGWTSVATYPGGWVGTISERWVSVDDGHIETYTLRNTGTEYGANLDVNSEGVLYQRFQNGYWADYLTVMEAGGSYVMSAYTQYPDYNFFGISAEGGSEGWLNLNSMNVSPLAPWVSGWCSGAPFSAGAENGEVSILAEWENKANFYGHTATPELYLGFPEVNVSGSGEFEAGAAYSGDWATIAGFVYNLS